MLRQFTACFAGASVAVCAGVFGPAYFSPVPAGVAGATGATGATGTAGTTDACLSQCFFWSPSQFWGSNSFEFSL